MVGAKGHRPQIVFSLLVLLAAIWAASVYEVGRDRREQIHNAETATALQAQTFAENTLSSIKRLDELLLHLRANWSGDFGAFSALVKSRQQDIGDLTFQIAVIDEKGYLAYSNLAPASDRTYLGEREHFRVHKQSTQDRLFISRPVKGKISHKWSIQFTRPIFIDGLFKGVLVASVSPDTFTGFHDKLNLSRQAVVTMTRVSGEIMARFPGADNFYSVTVKGEYNRDDAPISGNFSRKSVADGVERVFGYYKLNAYDLIFFAGESTENLLLPHQRHRALVFSYAIGISLLLIGFMVYLDRSLAARARAQARLLQESSKIQALMRNASDGICMLDRDGLLVEANEAFLNMLGYDQSAVGRLHVTDWSLTDPDEIKARFADLIPRHGKTVLEARHRRRDGVVRDVEVSVSGIEIDGEGYLYAAARDITERKRAEQALQQSERRYRSLVENTKDLITRVDSDGRFTFVNKTAEAVFGMAPHACVGLSAFDFIHPADRDTTRKAFHDWLQSGAQSVNFENRQISRSGEVHLLQWSTVPERDESGRIAGFISIAHDVTQMRKAEQEIVKSRNELSKSLDLLETTGRIAKIGGWWLDVGTLSMHWTDETYRIHELDAGSPIGVERTLEFYAPETRPVLRAAVQDCIDSGNAFDLELPVVTARGNPLWARVIGHAVQRFGKTVRLYGAFQDISERKRTETALQESRDRFRKVVEQSPLSMALVSMDGTIDYINHKAIETFGYLPQDIPNMDRWWVQAYPDQAYRAEVVEQWMGLVQDALANNHEIEAREYRVACKDGCVKTMSIFGVWVADQVLVIFEDVTERKQAEEQIRHLAYFDALTKLPNRRLLMDRLGQALIASNRSAEYGALMILDLDNFKALNDTQGHDVGDSLLIEVARRIVASVRQEDTVSRLGGDEYVVMVEAIGADETAAAAKAELIGEKVRTALNRPYDLTVGSQPHHSTPSIGVTLFRGNELPIEVLLKQADMALYQAKGAGRNTIRFFNPAMQAAIETRSAMEVALRHGMQHGEFRLFYQPQFDQEGHLIGAEALLRWLSPDQPPVSPAQFIPLAEDTGLIVPLGLWVMQTACAQLRAWAEQPNARQLEISINVSARQFRQDDFVEQIFDTLKQSGANPALLKLELTESVVLENIEEVIARMQQIKALGVTFSLDDFGTGFSSLSYLKRLPLDQVKIDQSFVRDITRDPNDAAIVRAIIAMSRTLGINVIAEGVETEAQLQFLKENGCFNYQGYLLGRPMPIENWGPLLA